MCGILGIVNLDQKCSLTEAQILRMRDAMTSRGPDSAGTFVQDNVALAHRRLAIRDLERGQQPWLSEDGKVALVYNGELYNDSALRHELEELGHRFGTACDTEVVLNAYLAWGKNCVERFRGMFALGIYDFRRDELFLARDRCGIKPLFVAELGSSIVFASSIPALLRHPDFTKRPNLAAISHYMTTFRLTLGRETVYEGIWQLMPGELLHWHAGGVQIERYWDCPQDEDGTLSYDEAVHQLQELLSDAIATRLVSDVPVGMFLSGGVDSNTIACLLRRETGKRLMGKCGGGTSKASEDFVHARQLASHAHFDYGEVQLSHQDYLNTWQDMLQQYETPLSTPSDVILYRLAGEMKKSVGVVLGGEGADELLCGYAVQHWAGHDYESSRAISAGNWTAGPEVRKQVCDGLQQQYGRTRFADEVDHYFALNSLIPAAAKPMLLQPWAWRQADQDARMWNYYGQLFDQHRGLPTPRKHQHILHHVNLESLLARLDSSTMLAGLEARVPFTDHPLVEKMFRVPRRHLIDVADQERHPHLPSAALATRGSLRSKRILRSLAQRLMPDSLALRKKASFPTPVQDWFSDQWAAWSGDVLRQSPFARSLFQHSVLDELSSNVRQAGMWMWPLLNLAIWGDRNFGGTTVAAHPDHRVSRN